MFIVAFFVFAGQGIVSTDTSISSGPVYHGSVHVQQIRDGEVIFDETNSNLLTNGGAEAIEQILGQGTSYGAFNQIALCNATTGCGTPVATDTTLENAFGAGGLEQVAGTYASLGNGNFSVYKQFTATANSLVTNKTGLFNDSTLMLAENTFTTVTLQSADLLTINWTIGIVDG